MSSPGLDGMAKVAWASGRGDSRWHGARAVL